MIWTWGNNAQGQLGNGTSINGTNRPVQASAPSGMTAISANSGSHSLALKSDNTVWAWGYNSEGQLGNGTTFNTNSPVQVLDLSTVSVLSGGGLHSLAIKTNQTVWAWGGNVYGQLGNGTWNMMTNVPVQVGVLSGVSNVAAGKYHSLALKNDGTVWGWGDNSTGQLGNGTFTITNLPTETLNLTGMLAVAAGGGHSLAIKNDRTVWGWGENSQGQVGDGTTIAYTNYPIQVVDLSNVSAVTAGEVHSLALKNDGTIWSWGGNEYGQLGNGTLTGTNRPTRVNGVTNAIAIAAGQYHSLALLSDGTVVAWGNNYSGEIGNGVKWYSIPPIKILFEPAVPTCVTASEGTFRDKVRVAWNTATGATGYMVWRSGTNDNHTAALIKSELAAGNYDDTSALVGILYYYWVVASNACGTSAFSSVASGWRNGTLTGDVDGDQLADIMSVHGTDWYVWFSTADYLIRGGPYTFNIAGTPVTGDVDGDRLADIMSVSGTDWYVWLSTANYLVCGGPCTFNIAGTPVTGDVDGDQLADIMSVSGTDWYVWFSTANYLVRGGPYTFNVSGVPVTGDVDGDRIADVMSVNGTDWYAWFSTANYLVRGGPYTFNVSGVPVTGDVDGDRLADVMSVNGTGWYVWFSTADYLVRGGPYVFTAP
jgi:alpha-tubulin suppressor-like RCC1 family protein